MTRHTTHTGLIFRSTGQSLLARTGSLSFALTLALWSPMRTAWAEPEAATGGSISITETTITETSTTVVSDRESRLRNMEDELLKQLSVGDSPSAQNENKPSLAEIKQVSAEVAAPKRASQKPPTSATSSHQKPASPAQLSEDAPAKVPVVSFEEIPSAAGRAPQAASIVPVSAKTSSPRKAAPRRAPTTESLSAKDLEHRLAIAETQVALLNQELETTKNKLATSESRVRELTDRMDEEARRSSQQSDTSNGLEARAAAVTIAEPATRPSVDIEVARVTRSKTPIRIGPGPRESIISHLSRDDVVTIEHRTSGWYRIVTRDGARGWISGSYLVFDTNMYPDSTVHVGAYEPQLEPTGGRY